KSLLIIRMLRRDLASDFFTERVTDCVAKTLLPELGHYWTWAYSAVRWPAGFLFVRAGLAH
ncbi:MAG TPA: hypothetical protein VGL33_11825, partial [Streptosporangiaceae bacterium]